ncbi:MAG TPA: hypothetical protein RMH99_18825 [Sandaracinaceae bacterium LLY-WYZ-13_1]|nr:hypothetical protein [Sandaracinaceae bacterium LLY-WYZ-13_1]
MSGGWVGYIYVLAGCGTLGVLLAGATLLLYAVAWNRKKRRLEPSVRVTSVTRRAGDDPDAA